MSEQTQKRVNRRMRATRTRSTIHGTAEKPRLSVFISNQHITAQLINDDDSKTIASATTVGSKATGTMTEKAAKVGADIAKAGKAKKVTHVAFDRGNKKYHGRLKALADAARKEGLEF